MWEIPEIPQNITDDKERNRKRSLSLIVTEALAGLEECGFVRFPVDVYTSSDGFLGYIAEGHDDTPGRRTVMLCKGAEREIADLFLAKGYHAYLASFGKEGYWSKHVGQIGQILQISCRKECRTQLNARFREYSKEFTGTEILTLDRKGKPVTSNTRKESK